MLALLFEVMDKEPSVMNIWVNCLIVGALGFVLCHYRVWWFPLMLIVIFLLLPILLPDDDPSIRQAILQEAGENYYRYSYPAILIAIVLPILGALLNVKNNKQPAP